MKIYTDLTALENEKRIYADIAASSNVRVNFKFNGEEYTFVPYKLGDLTALVEIKDEKEVVDELLESYIREQVVKQGVYPEEISQLARHFKTELKKFKILVVKYNTLEEKEASRYSLSNITFGVVSYENTDIHLIPANAKVKVKDGYCVSADVECPQEGIRQAFLIARWFGSGVYDELPKIALSRDIDEHALKNLLKEWAPFLRYIISSRIDTVDKSYFSAIVRKLNEFRNETYFDPMRGIEKVALGIILAKAEGGTYFESSSYDIF